MWLWFLLSSGMANEVREVFDRVYIPGMIALLFYSAICVLGGWATTQLKEPTIWKYIAAAIGAPFVVLEILGQVVIVSTKQG